jgi:hypothetical protein
MITTQQLVDAEIDAQALSDVVNGAPDRSNPGQANGTVTTRLGRVIKTLSRSILDIFTPVGAWSSVTTYPAGRVVTLNGSSYVSIQDANLNHSPEVSPTWWQLLASKGDTGDTGPTGATGAKGDPGSINAIGSDLDMGSTYRIVNTPDPVSAQSPATKAYTDLRGARAFAFLQIQAAGAIAIAAGSHNIASASWSGGTISVTFTSAIPANVVILATPQNPLAAGAAYLHGTGNGTTAFVYQKSTTPGAVAYTEGQYIAVIVFSAP